MTEPELADSIDSFATECQTLRSQLLAITYWACVGVVFYWLFGSGHFAVFMIGFSLAMEVVFAARKKQWQFSMKQVFFLITAIAVALAAIAQIER